MIIELTGWIRSSTESMSSNTIGPLPKKIIIQVNRLEKSSGDMDDIKKALVTTIDTFIKEGNTVKGEKKGNKT